MSFSRYNIEDTVISSETVVTPMWSEGDKLSPGQMIQIANPKTDKLYWNIYNGGTIGGVNTELQFSICYGHYLGYNSVEFYGSVDNTPTSIIYKQLQNLIFGDENSKFKFDSVTTSDEIVAISISRNRFKQSIQPGTLDITLGGVSYTDNGKVNPITEFIGSNRVYSIGQKPTPTTLSDGLGMTVINNSTNKRVGYIFPDLGLLIFNKLSASLSGSTQNTILTSFLNNIKGGDFYLQSTETVSSRYFFTRVKNQEFNYTTNPSIIDDNGNLIYSTLIDNPQTFITTIGLYSDLNELVAVAKLSHPLPKSFTNEKLLTIKLSF